METERLRSVLARVRWANVARLLAIAAVVVAVVGWARTELGAARAARRGAPPGRRLPAVAGRAARTRGCGAARAREGGGSPPGGSDAAR